MARKVQKTYDPKTGKWKTTTTSTSSNNTATSTSSNKTTTKKNTNTKDKVSTNKSDKMKSSSTDKKTSKGKNEKKTNTIEYNILQGDLRFIADKETIKIKAGDTITLKGIGNFLSGKYFVQDVTRSLSASGYQHSATVIKTDFGNSLKGKTTSTSSVKKPTTSKKTTKKKVVKKPAQKVHKLKKGENLWVLAKKYYGNGNKYTVLAKANNIPASKFRKLPIGLKVIIP